jgi:Domain of unknown function (DUF4864)
MCALGRLLGILMVLLAFAVGSARAQTSDVDQAAIRQVIQSQMAAFQKDDGATAYGYASPTIQQKFANPDVFLEMVKTGYPAVYHPREVEFRELKVENGRLLQEVYVVGPDGNPALAIYEMQRQPDGSWRINGCWLTRAPDQNV